MSKVQERACRAGAQGRGSTIPVCCVWCVHQWEEGPERGGCGERWELESTQGLFRRAKRTLLHLSLLPGLSETETPRRGDRCPRIIERRKAGHEQAWTAMEMHAPSVVPAGPAKDSVH